MSPRVPGLMLGVIVVLILLSRGGQGAATVPLPPAAAPQTAAHPAKPGRQPMVVPLPGVRAPSAGTPTIDLMAILATRRRISREADRVYLDSLFTATDSVVVRWPDRHGTPLRIYFVVDSSTPGWRDDLVPAARAGFARWTNNGARLSFQESATAESADIEVTFVPRLSAATELGLTELGWDQTGVVRHARVRLAIESSDSGQALSRALRERIAAHELGHALGLPHSDGGRDLMSGSPSVDSPSRRDQATLQLLYVLPLGSIRTP